MDIAIPHHPPTRPRIAVLDDYLGIAERLAPWSSLGAVDITVLREPIPDPDRLVERLAPCDVICAMRERTPFPASVLHRLPNLRLLVTTGMQNASIDVAAAAEQGVTVCGTDSTPAATVELTWALILAAVRHVAGSDRDVRAGRWQQRLGFGLRGRRLGVIGLGRNGSGVARIGHAFGMEVAAWSQNLTEARAAEVGVRRVDRDELLGGSDVVTIHLRLSDRTRGLLGAAELARLRQGAVLVNTSRGPIVDEAALLDVLRAGRITAALDVYDDEPLPPDHPLRSLENVVLSPHVGYVTEDNMGLFYRQTVEDIAAFLAGSPIRVIAAPGQGPG